MATHKSFIEDYSNDRDNGDLILNKLKLIEDRIVAFNFFGYSL